MKKEDDTAFVLEELNNATTLSGGLNAISCNEESFCDICFRDFFNQYLANHRNIKLANIIKDSGLSRQYAYQILNGTKKANRDRILALCFAAGMNLDEINHALIYAKHNPLYAKNKRDAIIIVAINSKCRGANDYATATDLSLLLDEQGQTALVI